LTSALKGKLPGVACLIIIGTEGKARKCAMLVGKFPIWLALLNQYWLADIETYKVALSYYSSKHPFERIIIIEGGGSIGVIY
jgi:hypothetical protein